MISPGSDEDRRVQMKIAVILPGSVEDRRDQAKIAVILPGSDEDRRSGEGRGDHAGIR